MTFFQETWPGIQARLLKEERPWLPACDRLFAALELTPLEAVRVVILGQDPYPKAKHAMGLAFSVPANSTPLPDSLRNIFRELENDTGIARTSGDLTGWARQGVLLLNTVLTVPEGVRNGHASLGWQDLASEVLDRIAAQRPTAFLLWGDEAQTVAAPSSAKGNHLVLPASHPSPLSTWRSFRGSRPFSTVNRWLADQGSRPIDWAA
jgi:uracil-DNA glycosylase